MKTRKTFFAKLLMNAGMAVLFVTAVSGAAFAQSDKVSKKDFEVVESAGLNIPDPLTPQTIDESGALVTAQKVLPYTSISDLVSDRTAWSLILLVFIQVFWVTMVYGPIAAYLVEAFPAKIRYTALSLPYHIGNGVFGGLLPVIGLSVVAKTGNIYAGLYYPMIVAGVTVVVGAIFLRETHGHRIWEEVRDNDGL